MGIQLSLSRGVLLPTDLVKIYQSFGMPENMPPEEKAEWNETLNRQNLG
jgi:hypothetical protein